MKNIDLVGFTGFVGSNILEHGKFEGLYNSKNIVEAYGSNPDLLIYAGVRAEKFLANNDSHADYKIIEEAFENIKKINPKKLVLISTIDIYKNPVNVDEKTEIITDGLHPYGLNRFLLEQMVREAYPDCLIIRLPGLFGKNIKKNFIYDLINIIPSMLSEEKYAELSNSELIRGNYVKCDNGFYKCQCIDKMVLRALKKEFLKLGFSALNFTDSRGNFQFYNLSYLYDHIQIALNNEIKLLNIATEPICINDIYKKVYDKEFKNELANAVPNYDFKTIHADVFNGKNGYIFSREKVMQDIIEFIKSETSKLD